MIELTSAPLNPCAVIDDAFSIVRSEAAFKGIELELNVAPDVPPAVLGDAALLQQIVLHLLSNAIKFTGNGRVRMRVYVDSIAAAALRFEVSDWGPGIALERQHLLFTDSTAREGSDPQTGGPGRGLAISKRLVESMGGTIGVISDLGCGSTFWFSVRLPVGAPARATADRVARGRFAGLKNRLLDAPPTMLRIDELLDVFEDDGAAVARLLAAALTAIRTDAGRLAAALDARDAIAVVEIAHRIKGTSGSIHAIRLRDISGSIEADAKARNPQFSSEPLAAVHAAIESLAAAIRVETSALSTHSYSAN